MAMLPDKLEEAIKNDLLRGRVPCAVVAAMGTTGTVAIDPLEEIADICSRQKIWLHVDAAHAGSALFLEEYSWMKKGIEKADSFVFNAHKWLFTNFDCSLYYVKDTESLIRTFEILPEYLKTSTRGRVKDYRDWGVPLGRRFRALKLWFVLRSFGLSGIREILRNHMELSSFFCKELLKIRGMELLTVPVLNFTCFRYHPEGKDTEEKLNSLNVFLLDLINGDGRVFLTHTRVKGAFGIRMLIGQTYVERRHVELALEVIRDAVLALKGSNK
jgi:aromatic-L-amino-acid decarboxylase